MSAFTVCPRCRHDVVPRCGCGARLKLVRFQHKVPVFHCLRDPNHAQRRENWTRPACLCRRANVGPDRRDPPSVAAAEMLPFRRTRSERRRRADH